MHAGRRDLVGISAPAVCIDATACRYFLQTELEWYAASLHATARASVRGIRIRTSLRTYIYVSTTHGCVCLHACNPTKCMHHNLSSFIHSTSRSTCM